MGAMAWLPRKPFFFSRWVALAASFTVNSLCLYAYAFGLFSDSMKENLGFSQRGVDMVASFGELGLWSSFLVGLMLERLGPQRTYGAGAALTLLGLGYVALAVAEVLPGNVAAVAGGFAMANFGSSCFGMTAQTVAVRNFPTEDRGKISGVIKSIFGISSAVLGVLYEGLFGSGAGAAASFLLLLALLVPLVGLVTAPLVNLVPAPHAASYALERAQGVRPSLGPIYAWLGAIAGLLAATATAVALGTVLPRPWAGIVLLAVVSSALLLPLRYGLTWIRLRGASGHRAEEGDEDDRAGVLGLAKEVEPLLGSGGGASPGDAGNFDDVVLDGGGGADAAVANRSGSGNGSTSPATRRTCSSPLPPLGGSFGGRGGGGGDNDLTWRQCLRDRRFYVLWGAITCGAGAGITVINNAASLAESLGVPSGSALVTALGLANAGGRLGAGLLSDKVVAAGLPRAAALVAALAITSAVHLALAVGVAALLYPLAAAAGICYGSMFSLTLAICGDLFGPTHLGPNYGLLDLGPAAGSFVFATWLASYFYGSDSDGCTGARCFRGTFCVTAAAAAVAAAGVFATLVWPPLAEAARQRRRPKRQSLGYL